MATVPVLTSVYSSHQIFIERFAAGQGNAVTPYLESIDKQIAKVLNALPTKALSPAKQAEVQAEIDLIVRTELQAYTREFKASNLSFAVYEAGYSKDVLDEVIKSDIALNVPAQAAINKLIISTPIKLGENLYTSYNSYLSTYWNKYTDQVNGIVANGFASGQTNAQIAAQILDEIRLTDGLTSKSALDQAAKGAKTLARTGTSHAATSARIAFADENDEVVIGFRSVATIDGSTTSQCRSLDQVVMKQSDPGWGNFRLPRHPNERSTLVYEIDGRYTYDDSESKRPSNFRVDGKRDPKQISSKRTYYEDLGTLSAKDQDAILGPTLGKAFRKMDDPDLFAKQTIDSLANPLTITEMKAKDNQLAKILRKQSNNV